MLMAHPRGPVAFFKHLKKWRKSRKFKGIAFRQASRPIPAARSAERARRTGCPFA